MSEDLGFFGLLFQKFMEYRLIIWPILVGLFVAGILAAMCHGKGRAAAAIIGFLVTVPLVWFSLVILGKAGI